MGSKPLRLGLISLWLAVLWGLAMALARSEREGMLADFSTSLEGRTPMQRHNARLAALRLDGWVIPPGGEFSFNRAVGPFTRDRGFKRAPVSFSGEILLAPGGGVCQVSSTLYNAALLAGMEILERWPHVWAPRYIPPGRDAAVAYGLADLRFRNPYGESVRLRCWVEGQRLRCRLLSKAHPSAVHGVVSEVCEVLPTVPVVNFRRTGWEGGPWRRCPGWPGFRVRTYRLIRRGVQVEKEWLSEDVYSSMSPVVEVGVE